MQKSDPRKCPEFNIFDYFYKGYHFIYNQPAETNKSKLIIQKGFNLFTFWPFRFLTNSYSLICIVIFSYVEEYILN